MTQSNCRRSTHVPDINSNELLSHIPKQLALKSRVHFRRGFDENGYAQTIILVDAPGPFVGTIALDALDYENVTLTDHYPYGTPPDRQ